MAKTYEQLISRTERELLENALGMGDGYVLDFSDRTFSDFFHEVLSIDAEASVLFNGRGTSKAKRLRSFIERASPIYVARALRKLWDRRESLGRECFPADGALHDNYFRIVARFEGAEPEIDSSEFEVFEPSPTLEELIASIRRDLEAARPQAALDRLHTYCMKRFSALIRKNGGVCDEADPLHSRVGKYVKAIKGQRELTEMSERIIKSSISSLESMNGIRNNKSFAHDNPEIIGMEEARFIFDSVSAILRFIKAVDTVKFED